MFQGYQCEDDISDHWGQYSPYFTVASTIPAAIPDQCEITFIQILSRHGARDPTASKTTEYNNTINQIHANTTVYSSIYSFIESYEYTLGADDLTVFGQKELVNSGIKFYTRYESLARNHSIFVRSSSEARVVESAQNFTQGYHLTQLADKSATDQPYPISILTILEADYGSNNTLNHDLCTAFENGTDSNIASAAQTTWAKIFTPPITARLSANLLGVNLSTSQTIDIMDLCPFNTVASPLGTISPFCALFTQTEWTHYAYYQTLGKYYGYSAGNPLGPTQGVGFTNELIARMTGQPVADDTSSNHTLDSNQANFPVGGNNVLFADFSHDNDMTTIFSAMGLYNNTAPLSNTSVETTAQTNGYSASWTVPFAARMYAEKMQCKGQEEELVRIIVNDRVIPLVGCGADKLGRCTLSRWVESLSFAREGGLWRQCFS